MDFTGRRVGQLLVELRKVLASIRESSIASFIFLLQGRLSSNLVRFEFVLPFSKRFALSWWVTKAAEVSAVVDAMTVVDESIEVRACPSAWADAEFGSVVPTSSANS